MGIYETVKEGVTVREAAERYGIHVWMNRKARCPFHDDHIPSLIVTEDHYHCFGCGAHGDVIDFTAQLFDLRPYDAARKLAADFGLDPHLPPANIVRKPVAQTSERGMISSLRAYVKKLEEWKRTYAPNAPGDILDIRFIEACRNLETARNYLDSLLASGSAEREHTMKQLEKEAA